MKLTLVRNEFRADGIFSKLSVLDDKGNAVAQFDTLEHAYPAPDDGTGYVPKVYNDAFVCVRGTHELHHGGPFETFEITGVEGHSGILFHRGNFNKDSEGCVLVGRGKVMVAEGEIVGDTVNAFRDFMAALAGAGPTIRLEVS